VAARAAQFGPGGKGDPGLDLGMDQRAGLALAAVGLSVVAFHETLMAGFDSGWSNYLSPIQYRHAGRCCLFMHQIDLQPIRYGRKKLSIA
jgi:hypothetical protein